MHNFSILLAVFSSLIFIVNPNATAHAATQKTLTWAADAKSGVPYMFVDPAHPEQMQGFEKDIIEALAAKMNRKLIFVQNEWESLVPGLNRGDYDIAANGLEITPERKQEVLFSDPYYATFEQIVVRSDDPSIKKLTDLNTKKTGTLKASLAQTILEKETKAELVFYEEEDAGYTDVANGRIDSFFVDYPIALYYAKPNPKLQLVGPEIGKIFYGIAVSKKHPELIQEINKGLKEIFDDGTLIKIFAKWDLLHPFTVRELGLKTSTLSNPNAPSAERDRISDVKNNVLSIGERLGRYKMLLPILLKGALTSMGISLVSMLFAITFGLILAVMRLYGSAPFSLTAQSIVEVLRGTPLLIQLYLIFFGLPYLGIHLSPFWAAIFGLGMNYGAYEAENYRAGIEAVPRSQTEAALALALSPFDRFIHVILPQAYRIILPPMTNDFISLIKDSSLVSVITMVELTTVYSQLASTYFDHLGLGILVAIIYFAMGYPFVRLARKLESNLKKKT